MLPSIPVSPLIQQSLSCASQLADLTQSPSSSEAVISQQRHRLDQLTQQMHGVRAVLFHQWHPEILAKQIVAVDAQLFNSASTHDRLDDFHQYLMHSLAHQLIITNSYAAFDHAVRLAHVLHHYRDWNGLMAVVRCLALPAVQRLSTSSASPLCHDFPWVHHDDATTATTNDTSFAAYRQALRRSLLPLRPYRLDPHDRRRWSDSIKKLSSSSFVSESTTTSTSAAAAAANMNSMLVAIPWLPPLVEAETEADRDLLVRLCRTNRWPTQVDVARSLLLPSTPPSSPASTTMLFSSSSTSYNNSNINISNNNGNNLSTNSNLPPILPPHSIVDLLKLGPGDLVLQHWLVSRPYLTTEQLGLESQLVESKDKPPPSLPVLDETLMVQQQDYDDGQDWRVQTIPYDDDDDDDDSIMIDPHHENTTEQLHDISDRRTSTEDDKPKEAVLNVVSSIPISATATTMDLSQLDQQQLGNSVMYDGDGDDVSDDDDDNDDDDDSVHKQPQEQLHQQLEEEEENEENSNIEPSQLQQQQREEDIKPQVEQQQIQQEEEKTKPQIEQQQIQQEKDEEQHIEPTLVEHQQQQQQQQPEEYTEPLPVEQQDQEVEIIIVTSTESTPNDVPTIEDDADSEQWTGYPGKPTDDDMAEDDDDEEWTGYPKPEQPRSTPSSEASEEEWKGYLATSEEAKWRAETILKVQQQDWQGYTLETLNEDKLESSTMINGEFVKSRHARECVTPPFGQAC